VLFVVQPGETNTVDQRMLEFALWKNHGIPVVRVSLAEAHDVVELDESTGRLALVERRDDGGDDENGGATATTTATARGREVAVVYYRAGYAPTDYPSGRGGPEWLARERLERGRATKCPNLGYHLAGTKKVQQELAREGAVERFFPDDGAAATARLVRSAFAGLYGLGADANAADMRAVGDVLFRGGEGRYVLKPQREGGGYNFYGEDMARKLRENCSVGDGGGADDVALGPALSEFILMERLFPPQQRAVLLRNGRVEGEGMTISELGCFGTIVASGEGEVVHNEYAGFLLRTKFSGVDEGGVASGFATLSSPYLC
jgi:glutathione synthase